ncbi:MAG: KH domain-containing protein [Victivallaceae bacterium]
MEEFVAYIVKNLVSNPNAVEIRSLTEDETIKLEIRVAPDDVGKVIGRRGNTIHALRTIVRRISSRVKKKVEIDLIQPENAHLEEENDPTEGSCLQKYAREDFEEEEEIAASKLEGCCQEHSH